MEYKTKSLNYRRNNHRILVIWTGTKYKMRNRSKIAKISNMMMTMILISKVNQNRNLGKRRRIRKCHWKQDKNNWNKIMLSHFLKVCDVYIIIYPFYSIITTKYA